MVLYVIIGVFAALLFINIYFRVKVLKLYKVLVDNRVEFGSAHIFSSKKMKEEILPLYPHVTKEILGFAGHIKKSIAIAIILVLLITLLGYVLRIS